MKKKVCVGLVIAVGLLMVCGSSVVAKTTLRYAFWDKNQQPAMEASIKEFMKRNSDIEVEVEHYSWGDYWTKVTTGLATGTAPDVFWGQLGYFPTMVTKGQLLNLQPYIERDKVDLSPFYPALVDVWKYKGDIYGMPKDWDTIALFVNMDMINKAGLDYPADLEWNPKDGGTFLKYLQKLTLDNKGRNALDPKFDSTHIVQYGFTGANEFNTLWSNFVWENGGVGVLDKPWGSEIMLDQPQAIDALQFLADLIYKYHVCPPMGATGTTASSWDLWAGGTAATITHGSWMLSAARVQTSFLWDVAPLPAGSAGRISCFNGLAHNIPANCKHKEEAWKLVKWMDGVESQKLMAPFGAAFPAVMDAIPIFLKGFTGKDPEHIKVFIDETANTGFWPTTDKWYQITDVMERELNLLWLGEYKTAAEAVHKIITELRSVMAK